MYKTQQHALKLSCEAVKLGEQVYGSHTAQHGC